MSFVRILWNSLRVARESQSVVIEKCSITNVSISVWKYDSGSGMRSALDVGSPQIRHQHTRRKTFLLAHRLSVNDLSFRLIEISYVSNTKRIPQPSSNDATFRQSLHHRQTHVNEWSPISSVKQRNLKFEWWRFNKNSSIRIRDALNDDMMSNLGTRVHVH